MYMYICGPDSIQFAYKLMNYWWPSAKLIQPDWIYFFFNINSKHTRLYKYGGCGTNNVFPMGILCNIGWEKIHIKFIGHVSAWIYRHKKLNIMMALKFMVTYILIWHRYISWIKCHPCSNHAYNIKTYKIYI